MSGKNRPSYFLLITAVSYLLAVFVGFAGENDTEAWSSSPVFQIIASESTLRSDGDDPEAQDLHDLLSPCSSMPCLGLCFPHFSILSISIHKERQLILRC